MSKYKVIFTNQFKRDLKLAARQKRKLGPLFEVIDLLSSGEELDPKYKDHALSGDYKGK